MKFCPVTLLVSYRVAPNDIITIITKMIAKLEIFPHMYIISYDSLETERSQ